MPKKTKNKPQRFTRDTKVLATTEMLLLSRSKQRVTIRFGSKGTIVSWPKEFKHQKSQVWVKWDDWHLATPKVNIKIVTPPDSLIAHH